MDLKQLQIEVHQVSIDHGWWDGYKTKADRNPGELVALIHSEASELLEALRHNNPPSTHIPDYSSAEEEMADIVIRVMDMAESRGIDLSKVIVAKHEFNKTRPYKHGNKVF